VTFSLALFPGFRVPEKPGNEANISLRSQTILPRTRVWEILYCSTLHSCYTTVTFPDKAAGAQRSKGVLWEMLDVTPSNSLLLQ